jgi:hypothetical protein
MHTKAEMREGKRILLSAMKYLEETYGPTADADIDMRPWMSDDHPISVAHWILAKRRFTVAALARCSRADDLRVHRGSSSRFTTAQNALASIQ